MITYTCTNAPLLEIDAGAYVFFCQKDRVLSDEQERICNQIYGGAKAALDFVDFTAATGSSCVLLGQKNGKPMPLIFVGVGQVPDNQQYRIEHFRRAAGKIIREAESLHVSSLAIFGEEGHVYGVSNQVLAQELVCTLEIASYQFNEFITEKKRHMLRDYSITYSCDCSCDEIQEGARIGGVIGAAVNTARHWCDSPAKQLTPTRLAEQARAIADTYKDLSIKVFNEDECEKMGMGGLKAVAQGSAEDAQFVILEYKAAQAGAPTIGLVGKGVTFDSGGLSIKPSQAMDEMKDDMAGAASVIATMQAIAQLKPAVNVIALAPVTENLPSGTAIKPGDIVRHYNGVTSEIKNTDAEGRLILADALAYAVKNYKLDALIDVATLTGACAYALGPFFAAIMSKNDGFEHTLIAAGKESGDWLWPLPFYDDYTASIKSDVADICNIGKPQYRAGTITAGLFLSHFVGDVPWAHIDIAGTSFNMPDRSYYRHGSTGFGVRLFVDMIRNWK